MNLTEAEKIQIKETESKKEEKSLRQRIDEWLKVRKGKPEDVLWDQIAYLSLTGALDPQKTSLAILEIIKYLENRANG